MALKRGLGKIKTYVTVLLQSHNDVARIVLPPDLRDHMKKWIKDYEALKEWNGRRLRQVDEIQKKRAEIDAAFSILQDTQKEKTRFQQVNEQIRDGVTFSPQTANMALAIVVRVYGEMILPDDVEMADDMKATFEKWLKEIALEKEAPPSRDESWRI